MKSIDDYLKIFEKLIKVINQEDNLVIGGSNAISLHGLNFRQGEDLDFIVFNPSERQMQVFENLKAFELDNPVEDVYVKNSYKYRKQGLYINFLIERSELPDNLLKHDSGFYINSLSNIINAKMEYSRAKDYLDMLTLIQKNFKP